MPVITNSPYFLACDPMFDAREGSFDASTGERTWKQDWLVQVKTNTIDQQAVLLCPGLPQPGSLFATDTSYDLLARAVKYDTKPQTQGDWSNWVVTVTYSTKLPPGGFPANPGSPSGAGSANDPTLEPPDIEWDYEVSQESPQRDIKNVEYLNSAKLPYSPPPKFPVGYPILLISRNEYGFNHQKANKYAFAVNKDNFLGYKPETVMCYPPKSKAVWRGVLQYFRVSYRLKFSFIVEDPADPDYNTDANGQPNGLRIFQPQILDQGSMELNADGTYSAIMVNNSRHIDLLNGAGRRLVTPAGQKKKGVFNKFTQFRKLSFNDLIVNGLS